jgi:hypothetical protein
VSDLPSDQALGSSETDEEKILLLEQKLYTAFRYMEEIRKELDSLKQTSRMASSTVKPSTGAQRSWGPQREFRNRSAAPRRFRYIQTAAPARGTRGLQDSSGGPPPEKGAPSRLSEEAEDEETVSQEQEKPDLQAAFLREARAVLIRRGALEMTPSLRYMNTNRNELLLRGVDLIDTIFIGTIEVGRIKRRVLTAAYDMRYGLSDRIQLSLRIPYQRAERTRLLEPEVQRELGEPTELDTSSGGLGDIEAGVSVHALREGRWLPDLILSANLKSDTGRSPFEVDSGELSTGTGFWGLRFGGTFVKVSDPAVLFLNGGYFYHHKKDDVGPYSEVVPPDSWDVGLGFSYALNPFLSLTTRFSTTFTEKTEINGLEIDGSDQVSAILSFGASYALSGRTGLDIGADIGITDDSPDFSVRVSTPFMFTMPHFLESWKPDWLTRF